jgi:hypothetical protein
MVIRQVAVGGMLFMLLRPFARLARPSYNHRAGPSRPRYYLPVCTRQAQSTQGRRLQGVIFDSNGSCVSCGFVAAPAREWVRLILGLFHNSDKAHPRELGGIGKKHPIDVTCMT